MFSLSKNKARWIAVCAVALIVIVILIAKFDIFVDKPTTSCIGEESRTTGVLSEGASLRQSFVPQKRFLSFIEVRVEMIPDPTAPGSFIFELFDASGTVLSKRSIHISELKDDSYVRFSLGLFLDKNQEYTYSLRVSDTYPGRTPAVWVSDFVGGEETALEGAGSEAGELLQINAQFGYEQRNYPAFVSAILLTLLCGLVAVSDIHLSEKASRRISTAIIFTMPLLIFTIVEILNDFSFFNKHFQVYVVNYIYYLLLYVILFAAINRLRISILASNIVIYVLAVINYYKILFRGEPLQVWDIVTVRTAINVSSSYPLLLSSVLVLTFLALALITLFVFKFKFSLPRTRTRVVTGAISVLLSALVIGSLFSTDRYRITPLSFMQKLGITNNVWNQPSNYSKNGLLLALTMNAQNMIMKTPEGYSTSRVEEISSRQSIAKKIIEVAEVAEIPTNDANNPGNNPDLISDNVTALADGQKPNIIVIMCESYSDLTDVAAFSTSENATDYIDSMQENTQKGDLYVSTYGGGTANSEFEFLTGNSMAFLPTGSVPYLQYVKNQTGSLAAILNANGYSSIAVHPYIESGWNRTEVYDLLGFEDFLSVDDFSDPGYLRKYISDESSFDKLIELYENKEDGKPIFLFNVTIQNHGGYGEEYDNFTSDIHLTEYPGRFPETEQYLSLVKKTDAAVEDLIAYFSAQDEPTVICFFGDHLPSMKNGFYETILGENLSELSAAEMQSLYKTEYFIWANYDIAEETGKDISVNYLSTMLMEAAGIDLPEYNLFLSSLSGKYPVITSMGVLSNEQIRYDCISAIEDTEGLMRDYSFLIYNNLFGETERIAEIFDFPPEALITVD
jgi:phosphoglycerol transferase MdoB-like AlkP superfamily enzyme